MDNLTSIILLTLLALYIVGCGNFLYLGYHMESIIKKMPTQHREHMMNKLPALKSGIVNLLAILVILPTIWSMSRAHEKLLIMEGSILPLQKLELGLLCQVTAMVILIVIPFIYIIPRIIKGKRESQLFSKWEVIGDEAILLKAILVALVLQTFSNILL